MEREIDQADCPRSEDLAEYGSPDPSFGGDVVFLRARDSAAPQTRSLEGRDRSDADEERGGVGARASDADPAVRGAAGAWLRGRLRRRATLRQGLEPRWSPFSPPCSPTDCRRWKPPAPRRSPKASIRPT